MVLQNYEIDGDNIIIPKTELERLKERYGRNTLAYKLGSYWQGFFVGKRDFINDILAIFGPLEE